MKFVTLLFIFISITTYVNVHGNKFFPCIDKCAACRNSLIAAKVQQNLSCAQNTCPVICNNLVSQWQINSNIEIVHFRRDEQDVCNTCIHLGHCTTLQCIPTAIQKPHVAVMAVPHVPILKTNVIVDLNKKFNNYYLNVDFVVRNLRTMIEYLTKYHKLYKYSLFVKDVYQQHLISNSDHIMKKDGLQDRDIALYVNSLNKINDFYSKIATAKIVLDMNKSYTSQDISGFKKKILDLMQFDEQMTSLTKSARHLGNIIKEKVGKNLIIIDQYLEKISKQLRITHSINRKRFENARAVVHSQINTGIAAVQPNTNYNSFYSNQIAQDTAHASELPLHPINDHTNNLGGQEFQLNPTTDNSPPEHEEAVEEELRNVNQVSKKDVKVVKRLNSEVHEGKKNLERINSKVKAIKEKIEKIKSSELNSKTEKTENKNMHNETEKATRQLDNLYNMRKNLHDLVKKETKDLKKLKKSGIVDNKPRLKKSEKTESVQRKLEKPKKKKAKKTEKQKIKDAIKKLEFEIKKEGLHKEDDENESISVQSITGSNKMNENQFFDMLDRDISLAGKKMHDLENFIQKKESKSPVITSTK